MSEKNEQDKPADAKAKVAAKAKATEKPKVEKPPWEVDPVAPAWEEGEEDSLVAALRKTFPEAIESVRTFASDLTLQVKRDEIARLAKSLKEEHGFKYMVDVAGADYPDRDERFEVVYHVYNHDSERRLRLKVSTNEDTPVPSVARVWKGAEWPEREAYDMFGIRFQDHPDMTRILLWEGFNGYPLRKDFPVEGIDTGSAVYPEYYNEEQGPIAGTGTGWKPPKPPAPTAPADPDDKDEADSAQASTTSD